jgi:hypothetical protein
MGVTFRQLPNLLLRHVNLNCMFNIVSDMAPGRHLPHKLHGMWKGHFYPEDVRQLDVGSSGVGGTIDGDQDMDQGSEEKPDN